MRGLWIRFLQAIALYAPGSTTLRVWVHRLRGVTIGHDVFIGTDALIETSHPELICIGDRVTVGIRSVILAHFHGSTAAERGEGEPYSVRLEDDVFLGPGAMILEGVTIRRGAVVAAGSVVTASVPAMTLVQGNPARPVARCGVPLRDDVSLKEFYRKLEPIPPRGVTRGNRAAAS